MAKMQRIQNPFHGYSASELEDYKRKHNLYFVNVVPFGVGLILGFGVPSLAMIAMSLFADHGGLWALAGWSLAGVGIAVMRKVAKLEEIYSQPTPTTMTVPISISHNFVAIMALNLSRLPLEERVTYSNLWKQVLEANEVLATHGCNSELEQYITKSHAVVKTVMDKYDALEAETAKRAAELLPPPRDPKTELASQLQASNELELMQYRAERLFEHS